MIATVHVAPVLSVPLAVGIALVVGWYWWRMGHAGIPRARRFLRRLSAGLALLVLPPLVRGLSFVDPGIDGRGYIVAWSVVTVLVLAVLFIACIDALTTVRQEQHHASRELMNSVRDPSEPAAGERS